MRRIGVLMNMAADDPTGQTRLLAFAQALAQAGWTDGRNVRIDVELANTHRLPSMFIAKHWARRFAVASMILWQACIAGHFFERALAAQAAQSGQEGC